MSFPRAADRASRDAGSDRSDAFGTPWRAIRQFAAARGVVGAVLCGYAAILPLQPGLILIRTRTGFLALAMAYLAFALIGAWQLRHPLGGAHRLLAQHIVLDLALLTGLLALAGGLPSGLAILLILPNAAAAILLGTRQALGFAAVSTLLVLGITTYDWLGGHLEDAVMAQAGKTARLQARRRPSAPKALPDQRVSRVSVRGPMGAHLRWVIKLCQPWSWPCGWWFPLTLL